MRNGPTVEPENETPATGAVSLYGQTDAMDDFPVLKAFQQYIDAEQVKAQKRTMTLCIFFAIILAIVIGVFMMLLMNFSSRNDQLLQMMLQGRDHGYQPFVIQPSVTPQSSDAAIKAISDSMAVLQRQLAEQQNKTAEATTRAVEAEKRAAEPLPPSPIDLTLAENNRAESARLKKALAQIEAQKAEIKKEKERLHQKEIDLQRRKLYPELYEDNPKPIPAPRTYYQTEPEEETVQATRPATRASSAKPRQTAPAAIRYFDVEDYEAGAKPKITESGALRYFDTEEDEEDAASYNDVTPVRPAKKSAGSPSPAPVKKTPANVQLEGSGVTSDWDIPLD